MSTEQDPHSGLPKEPVVIKRGVKLKLIKIAEPLKVSKEDVGHTGHEYWHMRNPFAEWLPRESTIEQNLQHLVNLEQY